MKPTETTGLTRDLRSPGRGATRSLPLDLDQSRLRRVRRRAAAVVTSVLALATFAAARPALAQAWNDPRALALATHATEVRAAQLADSGLRSYKATAHGYLTFLAQLGAGFPEPPKIVRADEVVSDLYWRAPAQSKQFIEGRRDTLLLPTDIRYHRDHLGIVQNNFPSTIRVGEGDEVRDVPHPLSADGLRDYDFALADSLQIMLGPRTLNVFELRFRPKDASAPRAVGSVYVDRESGAVVRMSLGFTRAALRDPELEDLSVILENGLIDGRFWLPRRQEVEIRRTGTWLDYPARGIIRGRWEISDYDVNAPVDWAFANGGPEIEAAPGAHVTRGDLISTPNFHFSGAVLDSMPTDVSAFASPDVAKLQSTARQLIAARALQRTQAIALAGDSVSRFVHVNRVEGIALGAAVAVQPLPFATVRAGASYGFSDHDWKPQASLQLGRADGTSLTLRGYRVLHNATMVPERSGVVNTFAAQEFGSDYTEPFTARGGAADLELPRFGGWLRPSLKVAVEEQRSVSVNARPATGHYEPVAPATPLREVRASLHLDASSVSVGGFNGQATLDVGAAQDRIQSLGGLSETYATSLLTASATRDSKRGTLALSLIGGALGSARVLPSQAQFTLGGPVSAPGYDFAQFSGQRAAAVHAEWRVKVPFVAIPLGAWGHAPASATLAPFVHTAWIDGSGWRPSVGVGALTVFDLLRFDVARGVRDGRWSFYFDVSRDFWRVL